MIADSDPLDFRLKISSTWCFDQILYLGVLCSRSSQILSTGTISGSSPDSYLGLGNLIRSQYTIVDLFHLDPYVYCKIYWVKLWGYDDGNASV